VPAVLGRLNTRRLAMATTEQSKEELIKRM